MSALIPDERFDVSAIDAIEEAKPTPPPAPRQSVMVLVVDESGPVGLSFWTQLPGGGRHLAEAELLTLARSEWPERNLVGVEWAPNPSLYSPINRNVLLVRTPGTHEVVVRRGPKLKSPPKKPRRAPVGNDWSPLDELGHSHAGHWRDRMLPVEDAPKPKATPLDDTTTVNTCPCCSTAYTARTFAELPLLSARDHREGNTIVHEVMRTCRCGSTRMVVTTRPAPEVLP